MLALAAIEVLETGLEEDAVGHHCLPHVLEGADHPLLFFLREVLQYNFILKVGYGGRLGARDDLARVGSVCEN